MNLRVGWWKPPCISGVVGCLMWAPLPRWERGWGEGEGPCLTLPPSHPSGRAVRARRTLPHSDLDGLAVRTCEPAPQASRPRTGCGVGSGSGRCSCGQEPALFPGPLGSGERRLNRPKGWPQGCGQGFRQARDGLSKTPDSARGPSAQGCAPGPRTSSPSPWLLSLTSGILPAAPPGPPLAFAPLLRRSGHARERDSGSPKG